jgi:ribonuclease P protein component
MLPSQHRLTRREDFALIYKSGVFVGADGISLKFLKTAKPFTRIGFPVGKNYAKKAVDRNSVKRVLREAVRIQLTRLAPGYDLVIMVKPGKTALSFSQALEITKKLFLKARLLS